LGVAFADHDGRQRVDPGHPQADHVKAITNQAASNPRVQPT
jgi:hypothetical protein